MALSLAQAAATSRNQLAAGVMKTLVPTSFILDRLNFETIQGNAYQYFLDSALPGAEFRAVNSSYAESTGSLTSATEGLVILGGDADVDRYLQLTRSDLLDQRATQVEMKARAIAHKFNDTFINGNTGVDANSFNGLKTRLTGGQVISSGTNGAAINTDSTTRQTFFDQLDSLIGAVPNCDVLLTNAAILAKFRSAARRETMNSTSVDTLGRGRDRTGRLRVAGVDRTELGAGKGRLREVLVGRALDVLERQAVEDVRVGHEDQADAGRDLLATGGVGLSKSQCHSGVFLSGLTRYRGWISASPRRMRRVRPQ